jgi:PAS domain S-box-containing protein
MRISVPKSLLPSAQLGFVIAAVMTVVMGGSLFAATWKANSAALLAAESQDMIQAINDVEINLARSESAQRGFLLSHEPSLLRERDEAITLLGSALATISTLSAGKPAQEANVHQLAALLDKRGEFDSAVSDQAADQVVALAARMEREELQLLSERRADELKRRGLVRAVVAVAVLVSLAVLTIAYWGFARQSRERERVQRQLRDLAESQPVTVYQFRTRGGGGPRFEFVGSSVQALHGVSLEATLTDPLAIWNTIHYDDRLPFSEAMQKCSQNLSPFDWEYRVKAADGSLRWVRSCASLRREADGSVLWNGYWADVTEQKRLAQALEQAKEDADAASRAKSSFLATMSHEIRTPLNGVLGMLELLSLSRLDGEQRSTLGIVRESGLSLLRIIDDILDFSKIEAGRLSLAPEVASVECVVERVFQIYAGMASSKGLLLTQRIDPRISPALLFDPLRLTQILNNFVSNAVKFTAEGRVDVRVEWVARDGGVEHLRLIVKDTGIGIAPEARQRLFEPFVQAEQQTTRWYGGTGLGLAICRRLAQLMRGKIEMDSEPGRGTTLTLSLSLPVADPSQLSQVSAEQRNERLAATLATRRVAPSIEQAEVDGTLVLVVDDHPTNRAVLARQVTTLGYAAETAADGCEALALWRSGRFALIVTDCNMPKMNGHELTREIRRIESRNGKGRTPIIACTANALGGEAEACFASGMDDHLVKPVELSELMQRLDRWRPVPETMPMGLDSEAWMAVGNGGSRSTNGHSHTPVDHSMLAAISGNRADAERDILLDFRRVNDSDAVMLRHAVSNADSPLVTRVSHRIKGASKMVGAARLAAVCESIEASSRVADWIAIATHMEAFQLEMQGLNAYLDSL